MSKSTTPASVQYKGITIRLRRVRHQWTGLWVIDGCTHVGDYCNHPDNAIAAAKRAIDMQEAGR